MIYAVGRDSHFPPYLYISDVVTMSTPLSGISGVQETGQYLACGNCYQGAEMLESSQVITTLYGANHVNARNGTDWTMLGSLGKDPLDWDYQATAMSNSGGLSNNHRIGYDNYNITCNGQQVYRADGTPMSDGYDHGD